MMMLGVGVHTGIMSYHTRDIMVAFKSGHCWESNTRPRSTCLAATAQGANR